MASPPDQPDSSDVPEAVAKPRSRWRIQLVWLVPLVAVLIGGWLAVKAVLEQGPTITISFLTGEGLEAGKTKIKFKNVDIGVVKSVTLSRDHRGVIATAELAKDASSMLVDDTRFWVVRPRISGGTVSGIGTLLSGSFIGMDLGSATKLRHSYVGLESPPVFASGVAGREFILKGEDLGSLDVGSPIFFRRLQVGQVTSFDLDADGKGVTYVSDLLTSVPPQLVPVEGLPYASIDRQVGAYNLKHQPLSQAGTRFLALCHERWPRPSPP